VAEADVGPLPPWLAPVVVTGVSPLSVLYLRQRFKRIVALLANSEIEIGFMGWSLSAGQCDHIKRYLETVRRQRDRDVAVVNNDLLWRGFLLLTGYSRHATHSEDCCYCQRQN